MPLSHVVLLNHADFYVLTNFKQKERLPTMSPLGLPFIDRIVLLKQKRSKVI